MFLYIVGKYMVLLASFVFRDVNVTPKSPPFFTPCYFRVTYYLEIFLSYFGAWNTTHLRA